MNKIDGVSCLMPGGTFYVFPSVAGVCNRLGITSHGLALYLLEGADEARGVACLGGECFGDAGRGFLRLSCAQPDERIAEAVCVHGRGVQAERSRGCVSESASGVQAERAVRRTRRRALVKARYGAAGQPRSGRLRPAYDAAAVRA